MMFHFFRRNPSNRSIAALYGMIVAQARAAPFYRSYGVPDTVNGRFEMVVLHAVLVLHRLESEPAPFRRLGQALFDRFCADMDGSLREMGVGDLAVPARMRKSAKRLRPTAAYGSPGGSVPALVRALARNVFGAPASIEPGLCVAAMCAAADQLADQEARRWVAQLAFRIPKHCP